MAANSFDLVVIDEASMLDVVLTYHILKALPDKTRLLFVGDVDLHWDAEKMLISQKGDANRYEVFEIGVHGTGLRQVTPSLPDVHNYDACYLPDGGIVFTSTAPLAEAHRIGDLPGMDEHWGLAVGVA